MENEWIQYYCREKRYTAMYQAAQRAGNDPVWRLYQGLALILSRRLTEGITVLSTLVSQLEVSLAAKHVSLIAHNLCEVIDREAVSQLEWQIKDEAKNAGELSLYYAAVCLLYCGKHEKTREYIEKLLQNNGSSCTGLTVKGWLDLVSGKNKSAAQAFKAALVQVRNDITNRKT